MNVDTNAYLFYHNRTIVKVKGQGFLYGNMTQRPPYTRLDKLCGIVDGEDDFMQSLRFLSLFSNRLFANF